MENNNKQLSNTSTLIGEMAFIILSELSRQEGRIKTSERDKILVDNREKYRENDVFQNKEWAFDTAGKTGMERWFLMRTFACTTLKAEKYVLDSRGYWEITEKGKEFLDKHKEKISEAQNILAHVYYQNDQRRNRVNEKTEDNQDEIQNEEVDIAQIQFNQDDIRSSIYDYLESLGPYEFQDLVRYLFIGMGYRVSYVSPKGPDGGVDIIAHKDVLGVEGKVIKIQVKHTQNIKNTTGIGEKDIRELDSLCKGSNSFGVIVSLKGFIKDVEKNVRTGKFEDITLIDSVLFVDLWTEHLDNIPEEGKKLFPLKKVYIVDYE